jgi:hypothetical protein
MKQYSCCCLAYRLDARGCPEAVSYGCEGGEFKFLPELVRQNGAVLLVGFRFNVRHREAYRSLMDRICSSMTRELLERVLCCSCLDLVGVSRLGYSFYAWNDDINTYDVPRHEHDVLKLVTIGTYKQYVIFEQFAVPGNQ